jgi:hypothetical protein
LAVENCVERWTALSEERYTSSSGSKKVQPSDPVSQSSQPRYQFVNASLHNLLRTGEF